MKILYDGTIYNSQASGGISRYYTSVIRAMAEQKPEWLFVIHINENPLGAPPHGDNIVTTVRRHREPRALMFPVNYATREWLAWRTRANLFHSTLGRPLRFSRLPVVATIHDAIEFAVPQYYSRRERSVAWKRWNAHNADAILAVSEQSKMDIVRYLGARPERVRVVYLAASETFRPGGSGEVSNFKRRVGLERPYVLYVGHRGEHKNFNVVAKAFRDPRLVEFDLVLAGGVTPSGEAMTAMKRVGQVKHIPRPDDDVLRLLYAGAHVFVFPSLYEGFGIPLLEAMKCAVPVVASDIPTNREVCGNACVYFPPEDAEALVQAIPSAGEMARRRELVTAGLQRVRAYSWEKCARETISLYEAVYSNGAGR